jgi:hypothetical protein
MHDVLAWLGSLGSGLVGLAIDIGTFAGAIAAGAYSAKYTGKNWLGWMVGILALILFVVVFGPIREVARHIECHGDQDCLDGIPGD